MSSYREQSNHAKDVRRGIKDGKAPKANRKKPKVKGPWKVVWQPPWKKTGTWVMHHCATEELAQKLCRKHHWSEDLKIEYRPE